MKKIFKFEVYVPTEYCDTVKDAMFTAGAGKLGSYDKCSWQTTPGVGQFRPLDGSNPFIGSRNKTEKVEEIKIEMICPEESIKDVISAINSNHPYETPAFQYWEVAGE